MILGESIILISNIKPFSACVTFKLVLTSVNGHMAFQLLFVHVGFRAIFTVIFQTLMNSDVSLIITRTVETLSTTFTIVTKLSRLQLHMFI